MRHTLTLLVLFLAGSFSMPAAPDGHTFAIRGLLPWHNFLSGPSTWDEPEYTAYLDRMKELGLNYLALHCYTGGAERYAPYVEPLIRMEYRDVLPEAGFDTSLTARWGYRPMPVSEFVFGTPKLFPLPADANVFGARCAILATNNAHRYLLAQDLMRRVIALAHERGIQVGLGFEFGIHPPEFASIVPPDSWIRGAMLPDPTHPANREILQLTLDDILRAYPGIDWIWLWLHEHTMHIGKPQLSGRFQKVMAESASLFTGTAAEDELFTTAWSLAYIRLAHEHLARRAPKVRLAISGWGGGTQLPGTLKALDRALPTNIVFTCLNPNQGASAQPAILGEIAGRREAWAIPWLEGDASLWHLQPRVHFLRDQIQLAARQGLQGLLAIHWRTEELLGNLEAYARFAAAADKAPSPDAFYKDYCTREFGAAGAGELVPMLMQFDREQTLALNSPEYFPYDPSWGRLRSGLREKLEQHVATLDRLATAPDSTETRNLRWLRDNLRFTILLDQVGRSLEPAYRLKQRFHAGELPPDQRREQTATARAALNSAPLEDLFRTYARRVRSRGELGELSSLNQRVWLQARELQTFLSNLEKGE